MKKHRVLIITDHRNHSSENSLYALATAMLQSPHTASVDIASRHNELNKDFFAHKALSPLWVTTITEQIAYSTENHPLDKVDKVGHIESYDLIWLRLPPPISLESLNHFSATFHNQCIINDPKGIYATGSKEFLTNFTSVCPPLKVCRSIEDIIEIKEKFPIVLKPFREYGGKGIVKIDNQQVWESKRQLSFDAFKSELRGAQVEFLAVKYLKNVHQGDKRIIVVNGQTLGASLRLPLKDSWICNVALGGSSHSTDITEAENNIIKTINPTLQKMGIAMYGVDTLVGDDGERLLSEINTTSIGGLPQIARLNNKPLVAKSIDLIWQYYFSKKRNI